MSKAAQDNLDKLMQEFGATEDQERLSSASIVLDALLGGGVPLGLFVEIYSASGLGKTTSVLHCCRAACAQGKKVVYLDFEQAVNKSQLDGIKLTEFIEKKQFFLMQPVTFEDAEMIIDKLTGMEDLAYIVIDSITAMLPGKMTEKSIADVEPGLHARFASTFLIKYKSWCKQNNVTFFFVNQVRTKLNFRGMSREESAGGNAQKFYMDIRIELRLSSRLEKKMLTSEGEQVVQYGSNVTAMTIKNKYGPCFVPVILTILYGKGISNVFAYRRWLEMNGYLKMGGAGWYTFNLGDKEFKARGEPALIKEIREHTVEIRKEIEAKGGYLLIEKDTDE